MLFTNSPVDLSSLPRASEVNYQSLEKNYLIASILRVLIFFAIIGVVCAAFVLNPEFDMSQLARWGIVAGWVVLLLLSIGLAWKGYYIEGYLVREKDLLHKKGVLFQRETAIPFNRVQHCEIQQGPIQRMLHLSTLEIFTAGGSSSDLSISGLHPDTAHRLKLFLLQQTTLDDHGEEE